MNIYDRLKAGTTPLMAKFKNPKSQVTYERLQRTPDGQGGYETEWAQVGAFDAVVLPASGTEQLEAQRLESQVSHKILALYDDANGITAADRVLFDGRVFNVEAVTDIAEGEMWLKIMCREGVASGPSATPVPVTPSCAYPLDASDAEVQALGADGLPAINGSVISYSIAGSHGINLLAAGAGISTASAQTVLLPSGRAVVELGLDDLPVMGGTGDAERVGVSLTLLAQDFSQIWNLIAKVRIGEAFDVIATDGFTGGESVAVDLLVGLNSAPPEMAIVVDFDAGIVSAHIGGQAYVQTAADVSAGYMLLVGITELNGDTNGDPSDNGKAVSASLRVSATDYTGSYPAGSSDICGNVFN